MDKLNVRITADPTSGSVINKSENPNWGHIRVEMDRPVFNDATGFVKVKRVSALIHGEVKDLERFGWADGEMIGGTIIFREQLLPFRKGEAGKKDIKIAGETGIQCKVGDSPIYRQTFYSSNPNAQDVPVAHTNGQEIKEAYQETEEFEGTDKVKDQIDL